jgi:hypothetical protein
MKSVFALGTALALAVAGPASATVWTLNAGSVLIVKTSAYEAVSWQHSGFGAYEAHGVLTYDPNECYRNEDPTCEDEDGLDQIVGDETFIVRSNVFQAADLYYPCRCSGDSVLRLTATQGTVYIQGFDDAQVASVPEPATWGMMILGFGMVGAGMRRRKSTLVAA